MVFAAPLFFISQTRRFRGFYLQHQQAFVNMAFGLGISYLGLALLGKMHEVGEVRGELEGARGELAAVMARLGDAGWLAEFARDAGCSAPPDGVRAQLLAAAGEAARDERRRRRELAAAGGGGGGGVAGGVLGRMASMRHRPAVPPAAAGTGGGELPPAADGMGTAEAAEAAAGAAVVGVGGAAGAPVEGAPVAAGAPQHPTAGGRSLPRPGLL